MKNKFWLENMKAIVAGCVVGLIVLGLIYWKFFMTPEQPAYGGYPPGYPPQGGAPPPVADAGAADAGAEPASDAGAAGGEDAGGIEHNLSSCSCFGVQLKLL